MGEAAYSVIICCGDTKLEVNLDMVDEWALPKWDAALRLLVRGERQNDDASETLARWFPAAIKFAGTMISFDPAYKKRKEKLEKRYEHFLKMTKRKGEN